MKIDRPSFPAVTLLAMLPGLFLLAPGTAGATGTPAGTAIQNTAQVTYTIGGAPVTTSSNSVSVIVNETVDALVTLQSPTINVAPGATQQELVFLLTNTGNGPETYRLAGDSAISGDDFDPVPATPFIYFDTDASGDLSPGDTPYLAGSNDPTLAADANVTVILVNDIPAGLANGNRGLSSLTASAATGTGAPGTTFAGQGIGGVDAVLGTSGGDGAATGEYFVGDVTLSATKSQVVTDPFGGTSPVPGATIEYQIILAATGTGVAGAVIFSDLIPANTTYTPGTLRLNGAPLTDSADTDVGEYATTPSPLVRMALGDLSAASGPQTILFRVTIN